MLANSDHSRKTFHWFGQAERWNRFHPHRAPLPCFSWAQYKWWQALKSSKGRHTHPPPMSLKPTSSLDDGAKIPWINHKALKQCSSAMCPFTARKQQPLIKFRTICYIRQNTKETTMDEITNDTRYGECKNSLWIEPSKKNPNFFIQGVASLQ